HELGNRVFQQPRGLIDSENANWGRDFFSLRALLCRIAHAITASQSEIERRGQDAPEIVSRNRRETLSGFFIAQASQPFVDLRGCYFGNRLTIEALRKLR